MSLRICAPRLLSGGVGSRRPSLPRTEGLEMQPLISQHPEGGRPALVLRRCLQMERFRPLWSRMNEKGTPGRVCRMSERQERNRSQKPPEGTRRQGRGWDAAVNRASPRRLRPAGGPDPSSPRPAQGDVRHAGRGLRLEPRPAHLFQHEVQEEDNLGSRPWDSPGNTDSTSGARAERQAQGDRPRGRGRAGRGALGPPAAALCKSGSSHPKG